MTQYRRFLIFLSFMSVSLSAMDSNLARRFHYHYDGTTSYQDLLPPTQPTRRTKKPTLLFEYFGLPESYAQSAAVNAKQVIVEKILNAQPIWRKKITICHQDVHSVVYSNDGRTIVTAGSDNAVCLADQAGRIITTKKYHQGLLRDAVFHPTDQSLIVCLDQVFDKIDAQGKTLKTIRTGLDPIKCAVNAKKNELVAIDGHGLLKVWSLSGGMPFEKKFDMQAVFDLACHDSGDLFAVVSGGVQLFERSTGQLVNLPHAALVKAAAFQPCGNMLVTGSEDGLLTLWKQKKADAKKSLSTLDWEVTKIIPNEKRFPTIDLVQFHPRGHLFATLHSAWNRITLWDSMGNSIIKIPHTNGMRSLAFHPNNHEFAVGHQPGTPVVLWQQEKFPTLEQVLLRLILKQYIIKCVAARRKPGFPSNASTDKFIDWMCDWFYLEKETLLKVWNTFSEKQRVIIGRTYAEHARNVADTVQRRADYERYNCTRMNNEL